MPLVFALPWEVVLVLPTDVERDEESTGVAREQVSDTHDARTVRPVSKVPESGRDEAYAEHWSRHAMGTLFVLSSSWDAVVADAIVAV